MLLDMANLRVLIANLIAVDDLDCGEISQDVKEDLEKCFNMLKEMARYINDKIVKLGVQDHSSSNLDILNAKEQEIPSHIVDEKEDFDDFDDNDEAHYINDEMVKLAAKYYGAANLNESSSTEQEKPFDFLDERNDFDGNKGNGENIDRSQKHEVVVEQLYENWYTKPTDASTELIVKDISEDDGAYNIQNLKNLEEIVEPNEETLADRSNPNEVSLKKKTRGRPKTSTAFRYPSKPIRFNPKWTDPEKWVKFVDQNGDRICWYMREVENNPFGAFCSVCETEIRIDTGGFHNIRGHSGTKKHKKNIEPKRDSFNPGYKRSWDM
eukprot:GFUD01031157.1.p1 GENE.GFUD01031157.1~~GFUD01031157.1.p1  ORF type:complete len:324 (-),score=97.04 GFUD01031157.1:145-1116(-)